MKRIYIYDLIDEERSLQDSKWVDRDQYKKSAPHILVLEEKLNRLRSIWYESKSEELKAEFVKIAAIAVRALEEIEFSK